MTKFAQLQMYKFFLHYLKPSNQSLTTAFPIDKSQYISCDFLLGNNIRNKHIELRQESYTPLTTEIDLSIDNNYQMFLFSNKKKEIQLCHS